MIIWSKKELEFIKKHLEGSIKSLAKFKALGETGFCGKDTEMLMHVVLDNFECVNAVEHINKILYDVLDETYSVYLLMGFKDEDIIELDYMEEEDCVIYKKLYELDDLTKKIEYGLIFEEEILEYMEDIEAIGNIKKLVLNNSWEIHQRTDADNYTYISGEIDGEYFEMGIGLFLCIKNIE